VRRARRPADGGWPKRWFDLTVASLLLLLLSPVMLFCAAAVRIADGSPVLFHQERIGRHARGFRMIKFRTMRAGIGPNVTVAGDARVTRVGRVLRRFKLDELPQLWNVLVGEMSFVGPRPELPVYVAMHQRAYRAVRDLRPGITDWASLIFLNEEELLRTHKMTPGFYEAVLLPRKLALARLYRRRRSGLLDVCLVAATACAAIGLARLSEAILGRELVTRARRFR